MREAVFTYLHQEIPYNIRVTIEEFNETDKSIHITLCIITATSSHYRIVQSKAMLEKMKQHTINKCKNHFDKLVFLTIRIKVSQF